MSADILLVDDDPKVLDILRESLSRNGYRITTAATGVQALVSCRSRAPELIVLDMKLPDMDGHQLMDRLRDTGMPVPSVLVLTADDRMETRLEAFDRGVDDYLVKPFPLRELSARIESTLRRTSEARALRQKHATLTDELTRGREDYTQATRDLKRQLLSMRTLFSVSQDLNRVLDPGELVQVVSLTLLGELQVSSMAMFAPERENSREFKLLGVKGFAAERFEGVTISRTAPFAKLLQEDGRPRQIARNPDRRWTRLLPDLRLAVFEYVAPIVVKGATKGLIFTGFKLKNEEYTDYDIDMMTFIANSIGIGMENARLLKQLQETYVATLKSLISIIEAKDPYTKGHTERVAAFSMAMANRLDLAADELHRIMFGSLLHDIGKLGVLENVLHKKGKLDDSEWAMLKSHPVVGALIVEKMEFLTGSADIVRNHHESWDGSGYPDGLKGEDISLGARIVTVADSFDAMTTDRSYRKALSIEEAIERLNAGAGIQFDPNLVRIFVEYIQTVGRNLVPQSDDETIPED